MNPKDKLRYLFSRYINNLSTAEEYENFLKMVEDELHDEDLEELLTELFQEVGQQQGLPEPSFQTSRTPPLKKIGRFLKIAAAVLVVTGIGAGYFSISHKSGVRVNSDKSNDIVPGTNGATLVLSNGKKIALSEKPNGNLASQKGAIVSKSKNGQITYKTTADSLTNSTSYNILATARGEQFQVTLSDGSRVWLNSGSALKFPTSFRFARSRTVELTGEAYFEVAKNKNKPFIVKTDKQDVQVFGTHFNIYAYPDEKIVKTTLLEGSVQVRNHTTTGKVLLTPGQQSILDGNIRVVDIDVDEAIAWKEGYFDFNEEDLESIMRKISRWYNVDVTYEDSSLKTVAFTGSMSKYKKVSEVLNKLALSKVVKFRVEGKTIIVTR